MSFSVYGVLRLPTSLVFCCLFSSERLIGCYFVLNIRIVRQLPDRAFFHFFFSAKRVTLVFSKAQRASIQALFDTGKTATEVSKRLNTPLRTVYNNLRRFEEIETMKDCWRSGRPITANHCRTVRQIRKKVRRNAARSMRKMAAEVNVSRESSGEYARFISSFILASYKRSIPLPTLKKRSGLTTARSCWNAFLRHAIAVFCLLTSASLQSSNFATIRTAEFLPKTQLKQMRSELFLVTDMRSRCWLLLESLLVAKLRIFSLTPEWRSTAKTIIFLSGFTTIKLFPELLCHPILTHLTSLPRILSV